MYKFKFITKQKESSNIWIVIISLLIFHFLYYYLIIHTTRVLDCMPYEEFWTWTDEFGIGLFKIFIFIFFLYAFWAILEAIIAYKRDLKDKVFCTISSSLIVVYVIYLMLSFKVHWELFEVKWGQRDYQDISFTFGYMPEIRFQTSWDKFIRDNECRNPYYYRDLLTPKDHDDYWSGLLLEFYNNGGTLEEVIKSNYNVQMATDAFDSYRKQGVEIIVTEDKDSPH